MFNENKRKTHFCILNNLYRGKQNEKLDLSSFLFCCSKCVYFKHTKRLENIKDNNKKVHKRQLKEIAMVLHIKVYTPKQPFKSCFCLPLNAQKQFIFIVEQQKTQQ